MLTILALLLSAPAQAGFTLGAFGTYDAPLQSGSASAAAPGFGALVGYQLPLPKIHVRPEIVGRWLSDPQAFTVSGGATVTVGDHVRPGLAAHVGMPVTGGYLAPAADAGAVLELDVSVLRVGLNAGVGYIPTTRYKCDCPQQSQSWLLTGLSLGVAF